MMEGYFTYNDIREMLGLPTLVDKYFDNEGKPLYCGDAIAICPGISEMPTELKDGCLIIHIPKEMEEMLK